MPLRTLVHKKTKKAPQCPPLPPTLSLLPAFFTGTEATHFCPAFPSPGPRRLGLILLDFVHFCMTAWHRCSVQATLDSRPLQIVPRGTGPHSLFGLLFPVSECPDSQMFHKSPSNELDQCCPSDRGTGLPLVLHDVRHVCPSCGCPLGNVCW